MQCQVSFNNIVVMHYEVNVQSNLIQIIESDLMNNAVIRSNYS